jgi:hypothetical protein
MEELYRDIERFVHPVEGSSVALATVMIRGDEAVFLPEPPPGAGGLGKRFRTEAAKALEGERIKVAWVTIRYARGIPHGYAAVTVSELEASRQVKHGQVEEAIRRAVSGVVDVQALTADERRLLRETLIEFNSQFWVQATVELKKALG